MISVVGIPAILLWILGIGKFVSRRYYENLACQLTDAHLEFKKGYLFRVEKTIPLENIQDLTFLDNPLLRWFDMRILKIETASSGAADGQSDMKLMGIIDTPAFKEKVLEQRRIIRNRQMNDVTESNTASGSSDESVVLLREIRDLLKEIREK